MHIYFEFYVKVEKNVWKKNSEYITAFSAKKIQISFITTIQFIKLLFSEVFTFNYVHITGNKTLKLCPQTFSKMTVINKMIE